MRYWPARRWGVAASAAVVFAVVVAIPTDMIDTPLFTRDIPVTWWAWPSLIASSILGGLLVATYVNPLTRTNNAGSADPSADARPARGGWVAGVLTFFAVGCPVCNKLVLLALGYAGAISWFAPVQPYLQLLAIILLGWALRVRLRGERECRRDVKDVADV